MPSDEPSPRPWRLLSGPSMNHIVAANSQFVCDVYGQSGSTHELDEANARLIVDAVNHIEETKRLSIKLYDPIRRAEDERDRLLDLVKRMADKLEVHRGIFTASNVWSETGCNETCSLIREARAAIGEDNE